MNSPRTCYSCKHSLEHLSDGHASPVLWCFLDKESSSPAPIKPCEFHTYEPGADECERGQ
jgi:hypothetical protein